MLKFAMLGSLTIAGFCWYTPVAAQAPAFDRPGIAFSAEVLPVGAVAWEQGLPDFEYDRQSGTRTHLLSAGSNVRIGISERLEVQIAGSAWNRRTVREDGVSRRENGAGDSALALKLILPPLSESLSLGMLASVSVATGTREFSDDATSFALGVALARELANGSSLGLYLNATHADGAYGYTFSPSLGFELSERLSAYVEAGYDDGENATATTVAGGGLMFRVTETIQLDASANFGLNSQSPDVSGGIGLSVLFL